MMTTSSEGIFDRDYSIIRIDTPAKILGPLYYFATAKARDLKFGMQLMFVKSHHKNRLKLGWLWARGSSQNFETPLLFL